MDKLELEDKDWFDTPEDETCRVKDGFLEFFSVQFFDLDLDLFVEL